MSTIIFDSPAAEEPIGEQRALLRRVSWEDYERLLAIRGDDPAPRFYYLDGELEIMSPSPEHERLKKVYARLIEAYADERGIELEGFGSMTMRYKPKKGGAEPDECYIVGSRKKGRPDFALEIWLTSGGVDKLEIYRRLKVREVWVWHKGDVQVYALRAEGYEPIAASEVLAELDLALVGRLVGLRQTQAVRELRAALRSAPAPKS